MLTLRHEAHRPARARPWSTSLYIYIHLWTTYSRPAPPHRPCRASTVGGAHGESARAGAGGPPRPGAVSAVAEWEVHGPLVSWRCHDVPSRSSIRVSVVPDSEEELLF
ncbi:hypothetical protein EVAR_28998_1 [Eumeta japonica]|uniref:Uncharacterized protein n=1 Tax=Eumeta variegata TaxID=151549 RepID=A0A4C1W314_EUMVA|nr:hypothetical protein EVAR_28998_1 [Eumeta japonica]